MSLQISHTVSLNPTAHNYRFGATYVGAKQIAPQEVSSFSPRNEGKGKEKRGFESYPVLLGDTDFAGNLSATAIHSWSTRLRQKFQMQVPPLLFSLPMDKRDGWVQMSKGEIGGAQLTSEYRGRLHSAALTLANTDLVKEQGFPFPSACPCSQPLHPHTTCRDRGGPLPAAGSPPD